MIKAFKRSRTVRLLLAAVLLALAGAGVGASAAHAYTLSGCKWPSSTVYHTRSVPSTYSAPAIAATTSWSSTTDVNIGQTSGQAFVVTTYSAADSNAGTTSRSCNGAGTIIAATSYGNTNYMAGYSANCRQATFGHEMAHGLGLDHNTTNGYVLMYPTITVNCIGNGIYYPQTDDKNGMNAIY